MTTIYWLTGAVGAGKSTLGAALAGRLPQTLFIDGDFSVAGADDLPFVEKIAKIKDHLFATCLDFAKNLQSAVISYPLTATDAADLRQQLDVENAKLILIGIQAPPKSAGTRGYTDHETKRQSEMTDLNGVGYADLVFTHPTVYLHDSVNALYDAIQDKNKANSQ